MPQRHRRRTNYLAAWIVCACVQTAGAQRAAVSFLDVGSEREQYLRLRQLTGDIPLYPWTVRALGAVELARLVPSKPAPVWGGHELQAAPPGPWWEVLPVESRVYFNSAFPYGINDGPVWAGRGATTSLQGGISMRIGPVSAQLEPQLFEAQNTEFALRPTNRPGSSIYANEFYPLAIDLPQRFGSSSYARLDPGQSTVRLDLGPVATAFSTANQFWGPAIENPIILGDNAAGFPHLFLGTSHPINVWIGQVHGRIVWGRLDQSPYSSREGFASRRLMAGGVGTFIPRFARGLELGAARFAHSAWPEEGLLSKRYLLKPFESVLVHQLVQVDNPSGIRGDNQLMSLFFRWVLPDSKVEIYGEYGRDDHWVNLRDIWQEPDHSAAFLLGLQRVWPTSRGGFRAFRVEELNSRVSHLEQGRGDIPWYVHSGLIQGHTQIGQLLGSAGGLGGGGGMVAVDEYNASGRWTLRWSRLMRAEQRNDSTAANGLGPVLPVPDGADVIYTLGLERVLFLSHIELTGGVTGVWDTNRDFRRDQFNLNLLLGVRTRRARAMR